ncbi:MAG: hypothetical protein GTO51_03555 [Candidatus Latescibacteria bacterium]|nr:hypothetical protein [Candidatus Latescibacterota bacterium]NIM20915.1 hypothetical protein [Candidatus Latescibacterota bacterium]NIM65050.1 hypothetical protein [Candidatus Latescibacterota bacterium]NIO01565.1 hypothetical protein [Candidatus Latescibacterota bacterium]NIO28082.1 hypothetical protein [Candidatus Latescibacterota bacterium]
MGRQDRRFIIGVLVLAAFLRLYKIGSQSLWIDEILTYTVSNPKAGLNIWDYLKYNIHGPLHSFVVYLFNLVSNNDSWLRLPSALAGTASVYVFFKWVDFWLGRSLARASTFLFAIHPLLIHYSQELRNYSFLFFFAVMASYIFHRSVEDDRKRNYLYYAVILAFAALSNFTAAFLYVVHTVIYFLRKGFNRASVLRWILVGLTVLALISPWAYRIYKVIDFSKLVTPVKPGELTMTDRLRGETTFTPSALPYTAYTFSVGFTCGPSLRELHHNPSLSSVIASHAPVVIWVGLIFGSLSIVGICALTRQPRQLIEVALYLFIPILLTLFLCWQNAKAFNVRYVLLSLPAYLCLIAAALRALPNRLGIVLWSAVVVTICWSLGNHYFNDRYEKEDVRGAAWYLDARVDRNECILVPTVTEVFTHYFKRPSPVFKVFSPRGTPKHAVENQLEPLFATCDSFWYVRAREWVDDPQGFLTEALEARSVSVESIDFAGVRLIKFVPKKPRRR